MGRPLNDAELLALAPMLAGGGWHSGERLARGFGITRAALAKRIARLRAFGLEIESRTRVGYRLIRPLDLLNAGAIRRALPLDWRARARVAVVALTDSTNTRLLASDPANDPQVLLAEAQTAGRGRRGRAWRSPFGVNLYLSLAWSFARWPPQLSALPLVAGVAAVEALHGLGLRELALKWPNDLVCDGRKLGGILVESRGEGGGACRAVIGIGLNVRMSARQAGAIAQPWTTLEKIAAGQGLAPPSRNAVAAAVSGALLSRLPHFERAGFAPFAPRYAALDALSGRAIRIDADGISGVARGVDADGALLVEANGRRQRVLSGDVSVRGE